VNESGRMTMTRYKDQIIQL